ncbi:hypothetical protein [Pseudactinotalea suaedae]|uniref:hypothetical protein n=1 Tax=Pseudactinotalea suaedae TaxID=1524924 RepID=UPI0012E2E236|nr:hypothetical protein [Pseudactinotalea suaedae]
MTIDASGLPWWATILILLVGGAVAIALSGTLWALLLLLMFGRWWRTLISLALLGAAIWMGGHRWLWQAIVEGWGSNVWVMAAVVASVIGIPVAIFMLATGAVDRVGGDRLRRARPGPDTAHGTGRHFADYGSESQQWQRELNRREP